MSAEIVTLVTEPVLWRRYLDAFHAWEESGFAKDKEIIMEAACDAWKCAFLRQPSAVSRSA